MLPTNPPESLSGLVADIGGTNARFAIAHLSHGRVSVSEIKKLHVADYPNIIPALRDYWQELPADQRPDLAVLAVAGPVRDQAIRFTNSPWAFSARELAQEFGWKGVRLLNDFQANALALPVLEEGDLAHLGGPQRPKPNAQNVRVVCGPGSGFGVSALLGEGSAAAAIQGEGGHVAFGPGDEMDDVILSRLRHKYGRVSVERLLSGPGLVDLYEILSEAAGARARIEAAQITERALNRSDPIAAACVERFAGILGSVAGDLAMVFGAESGVYIAGGIVPRLVDLMRESPFRARFEKKGRLSYFVEPIPTWAIRRGDLAMVGCGASLPTLMGSAWDASLS